MSYKASKSSIIKCQALVPRNGFTHPGPPNISYEQFEDLIDTIKVARASGCETNEEEALYLAELPRQIYWLWESQDRPDDGPGPVEETFVKLRIRNPDGTYRRPTAFQRWLYLAEMREVGVEQFIEELNGCEV